MLVKGAPAGDDLLLWITFQCDFQKCIIITLKEMPSSHWFPKVFDHLQEIPLNGCLCNQETLPVWQLQMEMVVNKLSIFHLVGDEDG